MKNQKALVISIALLLALLAIGSVSAQVRFPQYEPHGWESKGRIAELQKEIKDNTDRIQAINRELVRGRLTKEERRYRLDKRNLLVEQIFKYRREIQRLRSQRT